MPIIAKDSGGDFTPHPEGQFAAVCVDVVDKGLVTSTWNGEPRERHVIRVVFQTEETLDTGKPALASRTFTLSLGEKSALRPFLESWRGKKFSAAELRGFDVEKLIGANAVVQIVHEEKGDRTYDNITSVMKLMKGMTPVEPNGYIRVCDRPDVPGAVPPKAKARTPVQAPSDFDRVPEALEDDDDDNSSLPF